MHVPNWSQVRIMLEKSQPKAISNTMQMSDKTK